MNKRILIIVISVVLAVILAIATALITIKLLGKTKNPDGDLSTYSDVVDTFAESEPQEIISEIEEVIGLVITSPKSAKTNTTEPKITFTGTSDPTEVVILNGNELERDSNGAFSFETELKIGNNSFNFVHKGITYAYTVNYRYVVMNYYNPTKAESFGNGALMPVTVTARNGSVVTATFNGNTITLSPQAVTSSEAFINFSGAFKLPEGGLSDVNLGKIKFTATYNGISESFSSGNITCRKPDSILDSDPNATPSGGRYIDVGSGKITEIIAYEAETFDAGSTDDMSKPTNSYLPKGTVDYSSSKYVYSSSGEKKEYAVLRCGKQVYTTKKDVPTKKVTSIVKEYAGTLPDHNEIGISSFENGSRHTVLKLDTMWKAPFYFELKNQRYANEGRGDFTISNPSYGFIDITLCYATVLTGEISIPADNKLFSSAEIIKNASDYTLRLHLKKAGAFYGWDANYNSEGQLVFEFLNPASVTMAENEYGVNLSGVKILIDVGHGGKDPGALGVNTSYTEAMQNLVLANKLKAELESIGATVVLTREADITSSNNDKIKILKALRPDYCIAIHHNSYKSSGSNGFSSHYFHPFAQKAAEFIWTNTASSALYKKADLKWHYYYMARSCYCPVVLTENGYMSNSYDFGNIIDENYNIGKAKAMAKGIAEYFISIQ